MFLIFNPLEQFEVTIFFNLSVFGFDISLTNASFYMFLVFFSILLFFYFSTYFAYVFANSWQSLCEILYLFVVNFFYRQTNWLYALRFFPLFFCTFLFVLFSNLMGLLPFGFTLTSHFLITGFIAFFIFVGITIRGFFLYNIHFFKLYIVSGVPL